MPCGTQLIEAVAKRLQHVPSDGVTPRELKMLLGIRASTRAIRYAITELIKQGRAKRTGRGRNTAVYAVRAE